MTLSYEQAAALAQTACDEGCVVSPRAWGDEKYFLFNQLYEGRFCQDSQIRVDREAGRLMDAAEVQVLEDFRPRAVFFTEAGDWSAPDPWEEKDRMSSLNWFVEHPDETLETVRERQLRWMR